MSQETLLKLVSKQIKYYCDVKSREDGFDLSPALGSYPPLMSRTSLTYLGMPDTSRSYHLKSSATLARVKVTEDDFSRQKEIRHSLKRYMSQYEFKDPSLTTTRTLYRRKSAPITPTYRLSPRQTSRVVPPHSSHTEAKRLLNVASQILASVERKNREQTIKEMKETRQPADMGGYCDTPNQHRYRSLSSTRSSVSSHSHSCCCRLPTTPSTLRQSSVTELSRRLSVDSKSVSEHHLQEKRTHRHKAKTRSEIPNNHVTGDDEIPNVWHYEPNSRKPQPDSDDDFFEEQEKQAAKLSQQDREPKQTSKPNQQLREVAKPLRQHEETRQIFYTKKANQQVYSEGILNAVSSGQINTKKDVQPTTVNTENGKNDKVSHSRSPRQDVDDGTDDGCSQARSPVSDSDSDDTDDNRNQARSPVSDSDSDYTDDSRSQARSPVLDSDSRRSPVPNRDSDGTDDSRSEARSPVSDSDSDYTDDSRSQARSPVPDRDSDGTDDSRSPARSPVSDSSSDGTVDSQSQARSPVLDSDGGSRRSPVPDRDGDGTDDSHIQARSPGSDSEGDSRRPPVLDRDGDDRDNSSSQARSPLLYSNEYANGSDDEFFSSQNVKETQYSEKVLRSLSVEPSDSDIHKASKDGDYMKVKSLVTRRPDLIKQFDENGLTPLHIAVSYNNVDIVKFLSVRHTDLVHVLSRDGDTPLHLAVINGFLDCIKVLVSFGADVNCKTSDGMTPLLLAAKFGPLEVVKWLVENGSISTHVSNSGLSAVEFAQQSGHSNIKDYLQKLSK